MKRIIGGLLVLIGVLAINSCVKDIPGCTNSAATNYNSKANKDDGTCTYLYIGQSYQGGKIAFILQEGYSGYDANVKHGLIAASYDQGIAQWGCSSTTLGGTSTVFGTGQVNTTAIINNCSESGIAAKLCDDLVLGGYSDWYLPSKDELSILFQNKLEIGGFAIDNYWSSSEYDNSMAWFQSNYDGNQYAYVKSQTASVRAVRRF